MIHESLACDCSCCIFGVLLHSILTLDLQLVDCQIVIFFCTFKFHPHFFFISWLVYRPALMACVFIREALKEHLHGLKACIQQQKIHYPAPHADHDNAEEITYIFHGITFRVVQTKSSGLGCFLFLGVFFTLRIKFCEIFACARDSHC